MGERRLVWLLLIPLMLGGTELAHWLAFRLVYPNAWERSQALAATGHSYLSYWPAFAGVGFAFVVVGLILCAAEHTRGNGGASLRVSPGVFAALPPLAFALQEHLEALVHSGSITGVAEEPTFLVGVVLQFPFALVAYLIARLLLRVAELVGRSVRGASCRQSPEPARSGGWEPGALRSMAVLGARLSRGPPSLREALA